MQPIGPALIFGALFTASGGTVALPYLIAFIGMSFTLYSYLLLSKQYPISGALYSYVNIVMGKKVGAIAGWLLILDYVLIPTITLVSASHYIKAMLPQLNYEVVLISLVFIMGLINIIGVKLTASFSLIILLIELLLVALFLILSTHWLLHEHPESLFSLKPLTFNNTSSLLGASAIALFGYLGFDAIATLAEETQTPTKMIPKAMVFCLSIGCVPAFLTGYIGVLVIEKWQPGFTYSQGWLNAALFHVADLVGGKSFSLIYNLGFIFAMLATNVVGTTSASRLLFGMGRDNVLPQEIFSTVHKHWKTPYLNIIILSIICILIGSMRNITQITELINFGAITGFILLNISAVIYLKKSKQRPSFKIVIPLLGIIIMLSLFVHIQMTTMIFGFIWLAGGILLFAKKGITAK